MKPTQAILRLYDGPLENPCATSGLSHRILAKKASSGRQPTIANHTTVAVLGPKTPPGHTGSCGEKKKNDGSRLGTKEDTTFSTVFLLTP